MRSTLAVANQLITFAQVSRVALTGSQLQSLIYLAHGLRMGLISEPLLDDAVYADATGVVIPSLNRAGALGSRAVQHLLTEIKPTPQGLLDEVEPKLASNDPAHETLHLVWTRFNAFKAEELAAFICGADSPWRDAWQNRGTRGGEMGRTLSEVWKPDPSSETPVVIPNSAIRQWFRAMVIQEMKLRSSEDGLDQTVRLAGRDLERSLKLR